MGHVIGFCGDGFNDIAAIHATDIGIAVGASEAALTAPVFTSDVSAKGEREREEKKKDCTSFQSTLFIHDVEVLCMHSSS